MSIDCYSPDGYRVLPTFLIWKNLDGTEVFNLRASSKFAKHGGIYFLNIFFLSRDKP